MIKHVSIFIVCILFSLKFIHSMVPGTLGPADVDIKSIELCPNPDQYESQLIVTRSKINRTHEALDMDLTLKSPVDPDVSIYINFAKWGDGGYKPNFYVMNEPDACSLIFKFINETMTAILASGNEPPVCPIKAKHYLVKKYLVDYAKLPQELIYGKFRADVFLRRAEKDLLCYKLFVETKPKSFIG